VVISHDRWFLDRVCTHTLAFEDSGPGASNAKVEFFPGSWSEYRDFKAREAKHGPPPDVRNAGARTPTASAASEPPPDRPDKKASKRDKKKK
jgi:ATPase subunit of ABC transporter with duplicated ATPase domains